MELHNGNLLELFAESVQVVCRCEYADLIKDFLPKQTVRLFLQQNYFYRLLPRVINFLYMMFWKKIYN